MMNDKVNWYDAQWLCYNHGGHLPTISSDWEYKYVTKLLKSHCPAVRHGYLGYHDTVKEFHSKWVDGSSSSYTNWDKNEPNNYGVNGVDGDCSTFSVGAGWKNVSCAVRYESCFVCEHSELYISFHILLE